jgi:hypothetical protein
MHSQMPPYRPTLYRPGSQGRYRAYPHNTVTPIPGAGLDADELVWSEQELELGGGGPLQPYGNYAAVPLRGVGAFSAQNLPAQNFTLPANVRPLQLTRLLPPQPVPTEQPGPAEPSPRDVDLIIDDAAEVARAVEQGGQRAATSPASVGFFEKKIGPVPVWALGIGGLVAAGGAAWWFLGRKRGAR